MTRTPPDAYWTSTPKEGIRDNGKPIIYSTTPDVCKTPIGSVTPPIPYSIVSKPADDAGYTGSVRFTKQKVMVQRSNTTCCTGDEPGAAKGIKSGTVADICEPIDHSSSVRAEGSHIIRHGDKFHMNNKNTVGIVSWVDDTTTHGGKHILLAQAASTTMTDAAAMNNAAPASSPAPKPGTVPRGPGQVIKGPWKTPPPRPIPPAQVPPWVSVATSLVKRSPLGLLLSVGGSVPLHQKYLGWYQSTVKNDTEQRVLDHARDLLDPDDYQHNSRVAEWTGQELEALREEAKIEDAEAKEPSIASKTSTVRVKENNDGDLKDPCDEKAAAVKEALYRNKHMHNKEGYHGFLNRVIEQICGAAGPGTKSWNDHLDQIQGGVNRSTKAFEAFRKQGCDPQKHFSRDERNILNRLQTQKNFDPANIRHKGRGHKDCENFRGIRDKARLRDMMRIFKDAF